MKKKILFNNIKIYGINLLLFVIFWGGLLRTNYNADTIFHMVVDDADVRTNIEAGRYVIAFGDYILFRLGLRTTTNISVTMLLTFLIFALAMTETWKLFEQWSSESCWEKIGYYIGTQMVFLNVLFAELLMFNECSIYFAFGYYMAVLGAKAFSKRKYILMVVYLCLAVMSYQYTVVFAAIMIAFWVCLEHREELTWDAVKNEICGIVIPMGIGGLDYLSVLILIRMGVIRAFGKPAGVGDISEKVEDALESLKGLYCNSAGIFPNLWVPLLFVIAIWGTILISCYKNRTLKKLFFIAIVWIGCHLLLYVIPFMQVELEFPARMSFCFYLVQGGMVLLAHAVSDENIKKVILLFCMGYLIIQLLFTQFIISNRYVSNTLDEVYVNMAYQKILEYEKETGITVTGLAVADDAYAPDYYEEVNYKTGQINERCLGTVTNSLVWVLTGRQFDRTPMDDEVYKEYFEGKDWDYLNLDEQLIIIGDTAYWCVF